MSAEWLMNKTGCHDLSTKERIQWLRLARTENIGPKTFAMLLQVCGSLEKAIAAVPELSLRGGRQKPLSVLPEKDAVAELEKTEAFGAQIIATCEPSYPKLLRQLSDCPPVITVYGKPGIWQEPAVAMVGARNASANGCRFAGILARQLGQDYGFITLSGLARGIDTAVHQASLEQGTVAVVAGGINHIYPPENADLFHKIAEKGAVISESPFGAAPKAQNFPRRNRIVAGMGLGTVVVEASMNSGSLITARLALEQGREVMAVPGSPFDPRCQGTNRLLKQGAILVENAEDIANALAHLANEKGRLFEDEPYEFTEGRTPQWEADLPDMEAIRRKVLALLGATAVEVDTLICQTGIPAHLMRVILLELELANRLERHTGDKVSLVYGTADLFADAG